MYITDALEPAIRKLLTQLFALENFSSLDSVTTSLRIAKDAISSSGIPGISPMQLCQAAAMKRLGIDFDLASDEALSTQEEVRTRLLAVKHEAMVPALDRDFRSFSFSSAQACVAEVASEYGFSPFDGRESEDRAFAVFEHTSNVPTKDISVRVRLHVRMTAASKIVDEIDFQLGDLPIGNISFANILGIGFWRPSYVNKVAEMNRLKKDFSEPVILLRALLDTFGRV